MEKRINKQMNKENKIPLGIEKISISSGITLIALIITIIVMLVLAGIVITYLFSDKGPIEHAKFSKFATEFREIEEKVELYAADKQMENLQHNLELQKGVAILPVEDKVTLEEKEIMKKQKKN